MKVRVGWALMTSFLMGAPLGRAVAAEPDDSANGRSAKEPEAAAELIERAITLRRAGDDVSALEALLHAEKLAPRSSRLQVHLAAVYQALGRWEDADRYLSLALGNPDDYVQRHQAVLAAARRTIDQHMGSLQLSGGPEGTEVWLNGRSIGKLPIEDVVRVEAGIYNLEARRDGYYTITRSVALAGGALTRESVQLSPELGHVATKEQASVAPVDESSGPRWLGWAFAGLAVGAGVGTVVAWSVREEHVDNWNDDSQCLRPGQTRGEVCADERSQGDTAETWMWISGIATGAFAAASVITFALTDTDTESPIANVGCGVGIGAVTCSGRF